MKLMFIRSLLFLLSTLVVFLSMGFSVSKMPCCDDKIYIGSEVPNCMQKEDACCIIDIQKISCCAEDEIELSCCSQTQDSTCEGETTNIQFDFETLIPSFELSLKEVIVLFHIYILNDQVFEYKNHIDHILKVPLSKINKPQLSQIQSFLL
ncbi:MAG: hypothetical protein CMD14_06790 [Flavobacteriales bacterium]|nr:hypothetical protein [Flavobacteriales bacterium]